MEVLRQTDVGRHNKKTENEKPKIYNIILSPVFKFEFKRTNYFRFVDKNM